MADVIYEPRAFWSIANIAGDNSEVRRLLLDKRHFFNGTPAAIEIRRIALAAVNYTVFTDPPIVTGEVPIGSNQAASVLARTSFRISVPRRFHMNLRRFVIDAGLSPKATAQPKPVDDFTSPSSVSSLWGQCNLDLDMPMMCPRDGAYEWAVSAYTPWQDNKGGGGSAQDQPTTAWLCYQEEGGLTSGNTRCRQIELLPFTGNATPTIEAWPFAPDDYTAALNVNGIPSTDNWWPSQSQFPAGGRAGSDAIRTSFRGQQSNRSGSSPITGLRTYIDQQAYDQSFGTNAFSSVRRATPLCMRVGCRIRSAGSGSNTWFWRPGAPLALVFDTITPAVVYELQRPFTLLPGEQIDVEMEVPPNITADDTTYPSNYHIGISLNGFATLEG